jgi:transcriptional regulator with XRE-family HTH domain
MHTKHKLGMHLKVWRKQRKLTQEKLAEKTNMSVHAISSIERGINFPSHNAVEQLSKILEIPQAEFYNFKNDIVEMKNKKQTLIKNILGLLYTINERDLEVIYQQVLAFNQNIPTQNKEDLSS